MYCSGCGTQLQQGLVYCSRCGRRVDEGPASDRTLASNLTTATGYVGGAGFLGFIFVILVLAKNGVPPNTYVPIAFVYFAALFGICFLILRQASQFARKTEQPGALPQLEQKTQAYLRPVDTAQLEESRSFGIGSVTEHTTRALDEVPVERK